MDQLFTYKSFVHAFSGAVGGTSAITLFYPLNLARSKLMVSDDVKRKSTLELLLGIVKTDGFRALYQGWWSSVVSLGASNFVYFYMYNGLKIALTSYYARQGKSTTIGPIMNLVLASIAGVINVLMTTPLWVVGSRLTVQNKDQNAKKKPYTGILDGLTRIAREEGVGALWNGTGPSIILVSNPTIHFVVYERLREFMLKRVNLRGYEITPIEFFIMGAIAKMVATVVTFPLQIAQSRLRTSRVESKKKQQAEKETGKASPNSEPTYTGTIDVLGKLYAKDGFKGWFRGMEAKLWQTVLTAAFQFSVYEQIQMFVFWLLLRDKYQSQSALHNK
uniref:ADP,ATP carrier protein n=1 Tax=Paramoeba aestuarina TaxID=180227 RepID=A0A7S4UHT2_9EUKA|eukprot:CAMPEP_0201520898 /NCGR_PEP_ID=MMETSP0161_2-20130828/13133_1 /ASSEMBLY_ACC=CAM_ASM_000251 /TAXON_ID=180227 /ORGANISM="Neoparamoeba aestuarina, Strain SoJaBio B1-5/56/2" /LENGTH=332 /DNA_ID=CAMNT_0047919411 /DNA_START=61 /DNA_END=1059 /DNA_ORIENTATION=+